MIIHKCKDLVLEPRNIYKILHLSVSSDLHMLTHTHRHEKIFVGKKGKRRCNYLIAITLLLLVDKGEAIHKFSMTKVSILSITIGMP